MKVKLNKKILGKNDECALQNRTFFSEHNTLCLNVISSPGSGKTTIISRTILDLKDKIKIGVIEGDIKTDIDAAKISQTGAPAVQIETRGACHLSAQQITAKLGAISAADLDVVFIENVGNLVCPSDFDLGEQGRVVVLSVPEGDDKPAKYPGTFAKADCLLINKIDLLEHLEFDIDKVIKDAVKLNPDLKIFQISAKTASGMNHWYNWLVCSIEAHTPKT
ncbi:MAG TPA: hydrogenase nickel incorporation protein HypB [Planctomycetes bacterium]|nr:hydrogenase nickel incorporation protein HypB [Planctomycetota bacterium]HIJ72198.1 hydrogenase nickel incorporation protein HypB [Planctomycetota bacterium]